MEDTCTVTLPPPPNTVPLGGSKMARYLGDRYPGVLQYLNKKRGKEWWCGIQGPVLGGFTVVTLHACT